MGPAGQTSQAWSFRSSACWGQILLTCLPPSVQGMRAYEAAKFGEWCGLTAAVSEEKLKQPLFRCGQAERCIGQAVGSPACRSTHVPAKASAAPGRPGAHAQTEAPALGPPAPMASTPPPSPECRNEAGGEGQPALVCVNFDPELVKLLREVHDFMLLPSLPADIPDPAVKASD